MPNSNTLRYLVIHCTATAKDKAYTKEDIIQWHTSPISAGGRGWSRPGYSDMIYLDGRLVNLVPFNTDDVVDIWEISNGVKGMNGQSRHIVYVGGMDAACKMPMDTRNHAQRHTMEIYVRYMVLRYPELLVLGHNQAPTANGKSCPSFHVPDWLRSIGIADKNIYRAS
jgi:N-acetylmuramoyl-L-alanine amidase